MNFKTMIMATTLAIGATTQGALAQSDLMTPETLWALGRIGSVNLSPDGKRIIYSVTHYNKEQNKGTSQIFQTALGAWNGADGNTRLVQGGSATYTPDGRSVLFLRGGKLYTMPGDGGTEKTVADNVDDYLLSPDGKKIIIIRSVPVHTSIAENDSDLLLASGMVINDLMYKHWDHYVQSVPHPFVGDFDGESVTDLKDVLEGEPYECPMEPWGGAEQLAWSPDSKFIAYTCRKKTGRDYAISTDSDIYLYDVSLHKTVLNLCKPDGYTEPQKDPTLSLEHQAAKDIPFGGYDQNPQFSPDGQRIAWISMARDGYESDRQRLCVMELQTGKVRFVTERFESNVDEFLWNADNYFLYFTGVWHGKVSLWRTDLDGNVLQLTNDVADYGLCAITPDGGNLVVKRHSMSRPDDIYLQSLPLPIRKSAAESSELSGSLTLCQQVQQQTPKAVTQENKAILDNLAVGEVRERWVETTDGKQMLCWVIYPPHFDSSKKYPALLFCEGGPQSPVSQFWSYRWNFQIMAANGYIIIAPNRRGLPGFGMEWLEQISGDYTGQCMRDYLSAIDDLCKEAYVDKNRLGAVGASFGGFSVYWLAGNHEGRFKAFIAHDGIYNTQQQYVETEEMWFPNWDLGGAPWLRNAQGEMQKAYAQSPHLYVDKWDTPILCIHGQRDFRIEYTQAESAFNAARLRGLDAQLLLFPDENHWVLKPQNGILWQRTFFRFLDKHLK